MTRICNAIAPNLMSMSDEELQARHDAFVAAGQKQQGPIDPSPLKAKLGARYANCTLDNFERITEPQQAAVSKLVSYVESMQKNVAKGSGIVLWGSCGTGKDHLLAAVMFEALKCGIEVNWENGLDWFGTVRDDLDRTESRINELARPAVLAFSDPMPPASKSGKAEGDMSGWRVELLHRVIDRRYRNQKPTWFTLNVTGLDDLRSRLSVPLADRILDGAIAIKCDWESYRKSETQRTK